MQEDHQEAPLVEDSMDNGDCDGELIVAKVPKHGSNESLSSKVHSSDRDQQQTPVAVAMTEVPMYGSKESLPFKIPSSNVSQ